MKGLISIAAAAALLPLAACADNDAADDAATDTASSDTVVVPATEETTVVREVDGDDGDRVSIDADGVTADVKDGDTRVRADVDRDPSLTVESD